jgi:hypothetical protein
MAGLAGVARPRAREAAAAAALPGLSCAAVRAADGRRDRREEQIAACARVTSLIDRATCLAHPQHRRVRDGEARQVRDGGAGRGPVGKADAPGAGDAAALAWVAALAEWVGEARSH